jgi:hypothetical protein
VREQWPCSQRIPSFTRHDTGLKLYICCSVYLCGGAAAPLRPRPSGFNCLTASAQSCGSRTCTRSPQLTSLAHVLRLLQPSTPFSRQRLTALANKPAI